MIHESVTLAIKEISQSGFTPIKLLNIPGFISDGCKIEAEIRIIT